MLNLLQPFLCARFIQALLGHLGQTEVSLSQAALRWIGLGLHQAQIALQSHFGGLGSVFIRMQQAQHQPSLWYLRLRLRHVLQLAQR